MVPFPLFVYDKFCNFITYLQPRKYVCGVHSAASYRGWRGALLILDCGNWLFFTERLVCIVGDVVCVLCVGKCVYL